MTGTIDLASECVVLAGLFGGFISLVVVVAVGMWESALSISKVCGREGNSTIVFLASMNRHFHGLLDPPKTQAAIFIAASSQSCSNSIGLT